MAEEQREGIGMQAPLSIEQYVGIALSAAQSNEAAIISLSDKIRKLEQDVKDIGGCYTLLNRDVHTLIMRVEKLERKCKKNKKRK